MKLEKKTIYRVNTQEKYNAMMRDCEKQGLYWIHEGDALCHLPEKWGLYKENTCVEIDSNGELYYGDVDFYWSYNTDYTRKDYVVEPTGMQMSDNCFCVDADNMKQAMKGLYNYFKMIMNGRNNGKIIKPEVYTVRVEGDTTTVITPDGKIGTAKCHPDDDFDITEGFRVALEKIRETERTLTQREKDILNALVMLGGDEFYRTDENQITGYLDEGDVTIDVLKDDFKWCEEYDSYYAKEILNKHA